MGPSIYYKSEEDSSSSSDEEEPQDEGMKTIPEETQQYPDDQHATASRGDVQIILTTTDTSTGQVVQPLEVDSNELSVHTDTTPVINEPEPQDEFNEPQTTTEEMPPKGDQMFCAITLYFFVD